MDPNLEVEYGRRSIVYDMFDKMLRKTHGGDLEEMYMWIFSKHCIEQFEAKATHDQYVTDFHRWMKNRQISITE